jgi:hypothetical protein
MQAIKTTLQNPVIQATLRKIAGRASGKALDPTRSPSSEVAQLREPIGDLLRAPERAAAISCA